MFHHITNRIISKSYNKCLQFRLCCPEIPQKKKVDDILDRYIMNLQQHPDFYTDFYTFLFEIWYASGRSKKIRNEFEICVEKAAIVIENY